MVEEEPVEQPEPEPVVDRTGAESWPDRASTQGRDSAPSSVLANPQPGQVSNAESAPVIAAAWSWNVWNLERLYCRAAPGARSRSTDPCFSPSSLLAARASWGFGVRWNSPMGPLRFEWGFPFRPEPYEKPMLFEFTIGSAF